MVLSVLDLVTTDTIIGSLWPHGARSKMQTWTRPELGWTTAQVVRVLAVLTLSPHPEMKDRAIRLGTSDGTQKAQKMERKTIQKREWEGKWSTTMNTAIS